MIIGLTGRRLSGKSSAADYLRKRYGFRVLGFTDDLLRPMLIRKRMPVNRVNLIGIAMEIRKKHRGNDAVVRLLARKIRPGKSYAIAGIRFPEEASFMRKKFGKGFVLLAAQASTKTRFRRAKKGAGYRESGMSFKEFMEIERLPTERIIPKTMGLADFTVDNDSSRRRMEKGIDRIMEGLGRGKAGSA